MIKPRVFYRDGFHWARHKLYLGYGSTITRAVAALKIAIDNDIPIMGSTAAIDALFAADAQRYAHSQAERRILRAGKTIHTAVEQQTQETSDMSMSRDRVHFKLDYSYFNLQYRDLMGATLGLTHSEYETARSTAEQHGHTVIICRPSQFARFLIGRNDAGLPNSFKDLNPKLVTPQRQAPQPLDVSGNPASR